MTHKFEAGTLVMLKSGGPTMTVTSLRDQSDDLVNCEWFAGTELKRDVFDTVNLTTAIISLSAPFVPPVLPLPDLGRSSDFGSWRAAGGCAACAQSGVCMCVRPDRMIMCGVSNSHGI